jgi:hypothetical protein
MAVLWWPLSRVNRSLAAIHPPKTTGCAAKIKSFGPRRFAHEYANRIRLMTRKLLPEVEFMSRILHSARTGISLCGLGGAPLAFGIFVRPHLTASFVRP